MKKIVCLLLVIAMLFCFCACTDTPTKETGTEGTTSNTEKEETFSLNDTAAFKTLKFTATELKETEGTDFFVPEDGNVFVGVKFTIENVSDEEQTISSILLFEAYADDIKCDYSINAACAFSDGTLDGSIAPGKKLVGWYALEVPENWQSIELDVQANFLSNSTAKFVFENK